MSDFNENRLYAEIECLKQRNAELAAQIELINKAWLCPYPECIMDELNEVINKTPAQCLANHDREVAARAAESAIRSALHTFGDADLSEDEIKKLASEYSGKVLRGEI